LMSQPAKDVWFASEKHTPGLLDPTQYSINHLTNFD
jgi:hypothetical protein